MSSTDFIYFSKPLHENSNFKLNSYYFLPHNGLNIYKCTVPCSSQINIINCLGGFQENVIVWVKSNAIFAINVQVIKPKQTKEYLLNTLSVFVWSFGTYYISRCLNIQNYLFQLLPNWVFSSIVKRPCHPLGFKSCSCTSKAKPVKAWIFFRCPWAP